MTDGADILVLWGYKPSKNKLKVVYCSSD